MYHATLNPMIKKYHPYVSIQDINLQTIEDDNYFRYIINAKQQLNKQQHILDKENTGWQFYSMNDDNYNVVERTKKEIEVLIQRFEQKFNMTSAEFKKLHALGQAPDACETILWEAFLGLD